MRTRSRLIAAPHRCPRCGGDLTRSARKGCCTSHRLLDLPTQANDRALEERILVA